MRDVLRNLVLKLVGTPYIWGGGNPWTGFDCSGFVIWVLQVLNVLPSGDWTAQGLYEHFSALETVKSKVPQPGDLAFYGNDCHHITHVMMVVGNGLVVGASGGDHTYTTAEIARARGAQVKVKPMHYRSDFLASIHVPIEGE